MAQQCLAVFEFGPQVKIIQPLAGMPFMLSHKSCGVLCVDAASHSPAVYLCNYYLASRIMRHAQEWVGIRIVDGALEIEVLTGCVPPPSMADAFNEAMLMEQSI